MKKYPSVIQEEFKDCGVACISMLVKYYKGFVKKNTLIELTKTDKNGTTAYNIKYALENIGFSSKGISCNFSDINENNIILPCIANVVINNSYKHFIVIFEINFKKKYLIVGDPADKIKKLSFEQFESIFNKCLIVAFPTKSLQIDKDIDILKFLLLIIRPNISLLKTVIILSIFSTFFSICVSFYIQYMMNAASKYSFNLITFVFYIFFSIYLLKIVSEYFRNVIITYINQKIELILTLDIFKKLINLPYRYYHNKQTGDIISKINDLDTLRDMISKVALTIFIDLPLTIVSLIVLYIINSSLFNIALIMLFSYLLLLFIFRKTINSFIEKTKSKKACYTSYMLDSIKGFESIKGCHIEEKVFNKFEKKFADFSKTIFKFQNIFILQNLFKELISEIGFIAIIYVGCILVIKGHASFATIITFTSLLNYFLYPIKNIIMLDNTIKESKIAIKRILELIEYENKDVGIKDKLDNYNLTFKNVNFTFDEKKLILKNVNLHIPENSKVMVVGKSGCGKSTLFKLLMKYYPINNNKIIIGNIDINNYKESSINDNIIYIGQNEILFNDTLYNNIVFDNNENAKLLNISKLCELDDILDSNLGFNMLIEENGFNLSGGQKQRIVLARSLIKNFKILIIDEGLNQVDIDLERRILKNLFKEYNTKTIIVISHRLDNLDLFDSLIEFKDGKVKEVKRNG